MKPKLYAALGTLLLLGIILPETVFSQDCSTLPLSGGAATSTITALCPGDGTYIDIVGSTTGDGLTYRWENSSDNVTWTEIPGATNVSFIVSKGGYYYRRGIICNYGVTAYSSSIRIVAKNFLECYCRPYSNCSSIYTITNVTYGSVNNSSGCGT